MRDESYGTARAQRRAGLCSEPVDAGPDYFVARCILSSLMRSAQDVLAGGDVERMRRDFQMAESVFPSLLSKQFGAGSADA